MIERTMQQLDPLGSYGGRHITVLAALFAPIFAVIMTLRQLDQIDYPVIAVAALVVLGAAAALVILATDPMRAPVTRRTHLWVQGLAGLAFMLEAASMWQSNRFVRDDWGALSTAALLLAFTAFRPPAEIIRMTGVLAIFIGFVTLMHAGDMATPAPPIVFVIFTVAPILALVWGSARYAALLITAIEGWQRQVTASSRELAEGLRDGIARSVRQDRVTILNRDVVPFFTHVLERGEIDATDRERAHVINDAIRAVMVAEVNRSWLDGVLEHAGAAYGVGSEAVQDEGSLAERMPAALHTPLRALIVALFAHPAHDPNGFGIEIIPSREYAAVTLRAIVESNEGAIRAEFAGYLSVLRTVVSDLRVSVSRESLRLEFEYEQQ